MVYIINSAVIPSGGYGTYVYGPGNLAGLRAALRGAYLAAVSHLNTARWIHLQTGVWLGVSPQPVRLEVGDLAICVRLRDRGRLSPHELLRTEPTEHEISVLRRIK